MPRVVSGPRVGALTLACTLLGLAAPGAHAQEAPAGASKEAATEVPDGEAQGSPNIILFVVDDMGWRDAAFQGSRYYLTPHMDALASEGLVFSQGYSDGPNCAPTRASLMTGRATPRHGIVTVSTSKRGKAKDRRLVPIENRTELLDEELTLAEVLQQRGYATWHVGKWHLGPDPKTQGFEVNVAGNRTGTPKGGHYSPHRNPELADGPKGEPLAQRLTDESIALIEGKDDRPFFLNLAHYAVHTPIQAKEKETLPFVDREPDGDQKHPKYAAMVASVDRSLGRILGALAEAELDRETLIVLISDNGGYGPITSMAPLRGAKGMLYEGGIRVPFAVRWPGRIEPGSTSVPVITRDLYTTLAQVTGGLPKDPRTQETLVVDGLDLSALWFGDRSSPAERTLCWHFPAYLGNYKGGLGPWRTTPAGAIRRGPWKLLEFFEDGRLELYDLVADPGEQHDLAAQKPEQAQELAQALKTWRARVGARVPTEPEPAFEGKR